jgi:4-hydroxy-3-polyprenylbenzoate decarboxylase
MGYASLQTCVADLEAHGHLVRIDAEVDPCLEAAEIQRRVYRAGGPALLFTRVKGCAFPMVSNLFGTPERTRFMFRDALEGVRRLVELKVDPTAGLRRPWRYLGVPLSGLYTLPKQVRRGPVLAHQTTLRQLPQLKSWPDDGGAFITLPQVYTEHPDAPHPLRSNLGMYRVQLSGGRYAPDREVGLHYQIHRGIGVHHSAAIRRGESLRVSVFVGGPPAMMLAAVMPLPEGLSEIQFAGALSRRRVRLIRHDHAVLHADADFCITGSIDPERLLPEGPFGDHLGYYSLIHDFPVMRVDHVYHRPGAIWPFTVVGRPPQEDTSFGQLIHELTGPLVPTVLPGVEALHAVDAAGVHPLLLAIGSERYTPYAERSAPEELLTQANAILGQGQTSLAKYLFIAAQEDARNPDIHDIAGFLRHVLERVEPSRDLHFHTQTTIDTLDYSGSGLNRGSTLVIAAAGPPRRALPLEVPSDLALHGAWKAPRLCLPGVLAIEAGPYRADAAGYDPSIEAWCAACPMDSAIRRFPMVVITDDSEFTARNLDNFLWVTFTRSNPAVDVHGVGATLRHKHWGCSGPIVIDARIKPHHAPPLIEDPAVTRRVDALAVRGAPLHGLW